MTARDAAAKIGINRKTVERWRQRLVGFGDAYNLAAELSRDSTPEGRDALDLLVQTWTPGGLVDQVPHVNPAWVELREAAAYLSSAGQSAPAEPPSAVADPTQAREPDHVIEPLAEREHERADRTECVDPDVLDARGKEIAAHARRAEPSPYTTVRPPTRDEFHAMAAALMMDERAPERLRVTAVAALSSGLNGGPVRARHSDIEEVTTAAARERGRDPGVPASVWEEARKNFLGPAPEPEATRSGDVVEFDRAPG
jgi:hypothetical protein